VRKKIARLSLTAMMPVAFPAVVCAQIAEVGEANVQPTPQIKKLFEAFAGDLGYQREKRANAIFPERRREQRKIAHTAGAGGATLLREAHSDGTAGPLRYIIVVWWDKDASLYGYFTCFKDTGSGCEVCGTIGMETSS
jgi:hypothetical protein